MAQSIKAARQGLLMACQTIYANATGPDAAPVLVTLGPPGTYKPAALVIVATGTRQAITRPTAGTGRSRQKDVEFDITINVWSGGTEAEQQALVEAVDDLDELIEAYFRASPNEKLGGGCWDAWVSNVVGPEPDLTLDPDTQAVTGRQAESVVTITARIRQ